MKKRVVISEEQFKRLFLTEQNPPKKKGKSKAAQAAPPSPFNDVKYNVKPLPIDDLFNYHIKNKSDGDNFRSWVRSDSKRLSIVNKELSKNGFTDGLSKSGEYNNDYVRIAWRTVGDDYLKFKNSKVVDDYAGLDTQHPNYKRQYKLPDENLDYSMLNPSFSNWKTPAYEEFQEFKNYKKALSNWESVSNYFGWTGEKTVSSSQISNILNAKIDVSTCIDPSYVINKLEELKYEMMTSALSVGGVGYDDVERILATREFDDNLKNYFGDLSIGLKPVRPKEVEDKTYTGGPRDKKDMITQVLDPEGGLGGAYYQNKRNIDSFNAFNQMKYDDDLKDYEQKVELQKKLNILGSAFTENLVFYNKYDKVLEIIDEHNILISLQTKERHENACSDPVYKIVSIPITGARMESGSSSDVNETFKWSDVCKNNGGMWMAPTTPSVRTAGMSTIGFTDNKTVCCCVNPKGTAKVTVDGAKGEYVVDINIGDWCGKSIGDIRSTWEKVEDWGSDCASDWHCIADIASIVSLAFGPAGLFISALIDLVSAIGYVAEQDEGWKINAGLTALGALGGLGEALKLAGKGTKFAAKLGELGRITTQYANDLITLEREVAIWSRTLNADELKMFDAFQDLLKKVNDPRYRDLITDLNRQGGNLDPIQKGVLGDIFRKESPTEIERLYNVAGKDLNKMVNSYFKGARQLIIQGSLFAGMYIYSEEMGEGLHNLCKNFGVDLLGVFDDGCNPISKDNKPINPDVDFSDVLMDDPEYAKELEEKINSLTPTSSFDFNELNFDEELKKYRDSLLKIDKLNSKYLPLEQKIIQLHKKIIEVTEGYGMDVTQINNKLSVAIDIYNKIIALFGNENLYDITKLIDDGIKKLETIKGVKISDEKKRAISQTGNPNIGEDESVMWDEMMNELDSKQKMDNQKENKRLNEEIKRIKSLFGDDRLYGNLISEETFATDTDGDGKINEPEAKSFLNSLGYITKTTNDDDLCLSPNSDLKKVYNIVKSKNNVGFQLNPNSEIGCALTIYSRDKASSKIVNQISLFEGTTGNRFGILIKVKDVDCCDTDINNINSTVPTGSVVWNVGVNGYLDVGGTKKFGLGLTYIKIDGTWKISGGVPKIEDGVVVKLLNENLKGVKTKIEFLSFDVPVNGFSNTGTERGGEKEWLTDGSGSCISINDFVGSILGGSISDEYDIEDLIDNKM
jgi:hypothetical protein